MIDLALLLALVNRALSRAIDAYDTAADNCDTEAEMIWHSRVDRLRARQSQLKDAIRAAYVI